MVLLFVKSCYGLFAAILLIIVLLWRDFVVDRLLCMFVLSSYGLLLYILVQVVNSFFIFF